ncbi:hypothetical protein OESDEN_19601 [Oesophagostomum dentatum]|uniref:Uncharacterized protein n=1 Tax=Oesophagostomum dentatum TaxID=61180 RepID=A0A0B1SBZ2_OESDE|nr:hypothetical protein OESDEN_19601 [Oesophagostomum dentatum]
MLQPYDGLSPTISLSVSVLLKLCYWSSPVKVNGQPSNVDIESVFIPEENNVSETTTHNQIAIPEKEIQRVLTYTDYSTTTPSMRDPNDFSLEAERRLINGKENYATDHSNYKEANDGYN